LAARWSIDEVDVFGVGVGPGSFTGLRIGVTTARTLAHTLKKPLIGVSSLAALARPAALVLGEHAKKRTVLVTVTDAAKGELFALVGSAKSVAGCVAAEKKNSALWSRGVEEDVLSPERIVKLVKRKMLEGKGSVAWAAVGEGRERYPELWKKLPAAKELKGLGPFPNQIQGRFLGQLVWEAYQSGHARKALDVHPRYLRASDAELKYKAGLLPPGPTRGHA
jgi:tRNA threonylcarbamoyladenosine biosynthesis protein TsaB